MSWIDNILSSSLIVWLMIAFGGLHLYLKKTGKTLPEAITALRESLGAMFNKDDE